MGAHPNEFRGRLSFANFDLCRLRVGVGYGRNRKALWGLGVELDHDCAQTPVNGIQDCLDFQRGNPRERDARFKSE